MFLYDLDADPKARQLALADNRVAQADLLWDAEALAQEQAEGVALDIFWSPEELDELLRDALRREEATEDSPDQAEEYATQEGLLPIVASAQIATPGQRLHFGALKIPLTAEEVTLLTNRLEAYRQACGTYYGFVAAWLQEERDV